jgi:hypothetical protein
VSAAICPRPHQLRVLGSELDSSWGHDVNSEGHVPDPFLTSPPGRFKGIPPPRRDYHITPLLGDGRM